MTEIASPEHAPAMGPPQSRLYRRLVDEVATAQLPAGPDDGEAVTEADIEALPEVVRRYLGFMGVVGRPRDWSFRAQFVGRFRLRPRLGWMPATAWQYNSSLEVARVFVMRLRLAGVVPMIGRDTYLRGHGRMIGKLLDRVTVVDGKGDEFDIGELTTYLNDAVLLAPSMLLGPTTQWLGVDDDTFDVILSDAGRTVTGRVLLDDRGAPRDFSTNDRFAALPSGLVRAEWRTPVPSWEIVDGRPLPGPFSAVWLLPAGPFPYIEGRLVLGSVAFNVAPPLRAESS
ncbi:MAG: hypothetical protein JWO68_3618 [Actinomycetia bacterium]|nr:hypothetical protein [Actinomycetes bacterium]